MRAAAAAFLAAALCLFLSADHAVAAAAASSVHVVSSSTDVSAFAAAAARDNAVVHASWVGPVTLHEPIKVGKSSVLTIVGDGPDARLTYSTTPDGPTSGTNNADNNSLSNTVSSVGADIDGGNPALFRIERGASLLLENVKVLADAHSSLGGVRGGMTLLLNLLQDSSVEARGCRFGVNSVGGSSEDVTPADDAALNTGIAVRITAGATLRVADGCSLVVEDIDAQRRGSKAAGAVERGGEFVAESAVFRLVVAGQTTTTAGKPSDTATTPNERSSGRLPAPRAESGSSLLHLIGGPATLFACDFSVGSSVADGVAEERVGSTARAAAAPATPAASEAHGDWLEERERLSPGAEPDAPRVVVEGGGGAAPVRSAFYGGLYVPQSETGESGAALSSSPPQRHPLFANETRRSVSVARDGSEFLVRSSVTDSDSAGAPEVPAPDTAEQGDESPQRWRDDLPPWLSAAPRFLSGANGRDRSTAANTFDAAHAENKNRSPELSPPSLLDETSPLDTRVSVDNGVVLGVGWRRLRLSLAYFANGRGNGGGAGVETDHPRGRRSLRGLENATPAALPASGNRAGGVGESGSRVATRSLVADGVGGALAAGGRRAAARGAAGARRGLLVDCPEGYFGDPCSECATGFAETEDGAGCEAVSQECTIGNGFRAVFFICAGILLVLLTLDALWNAKSPCRRVAQMWRVNPPQSPENAEDASAMSGSTRRSPKTLANSRLASSKAFRGGGGAVDRDCCDGVCWGREGLGRFLQGCMVFIVTAQIITQGAEVMELEFPTAMERALSALRWTNLDPQSLVGTCVLPEFPFFDRVNGAAGLLTACLAALFLSHAMLSLGGPKGDIDVIADVSLHSSRSSRSSSSNKGFPAIGLPDAGSNAMAINQTRSSGGRPSRDHSHGSAATLGGGWGAALRVERQQGSWARWNRWSSGERHACAAIVVCLLLYPVVCTTLLRVLDCWDNGEGAGGSWLRADTSVECSSDEHKTYQMIAACFLGLYGVGLPLALLAVTFWAKGVDSEDTTSAAEANEDDYDDDDTTVAVRRLRGGALLQQGGETVPSTGPPRGFALREGGRGGGAAAPIDGGNFQASATSSPTLSGGEDHEDAGGGGDTVVTTRSRDGGHADSTAGARAAAAGARSEHGGGGCCTRLSESKAWRASGRWALSMRKAMSSNPDRETARTTKRWRSTIPVWSPYRANRHWFAAWELCRRLLLTGSLTAVSPDRDGEEYLRVAVACLLAGVSLVVGEVARPHRDPWICWIYRVGGVIILLMNLAGLIQKTEAADVGSPSMIVLAVLLVLLLLVMVVFVCGGWRLSCAEQSRVAAVSAAIIPRGSRSALPPRTTSDNNNNNGSRNGSGPMPNESIAGAPAIPAAPGSRDSNPKAPPRRLWSNDRLPTPGPNNPAGRGNREGPRGMDASVDGVAGAGHERAGSSERSESGGGGIRTSGDSGKRLPSYRELVRYSRSDSGLVSTSAASSRHRHQPSADSAVHVMNPMFSSIAGIDEVDVAFGGVGGSDGSRFEGVAGDRSSDRSGSGRWRWMQQQQQQRNSGAFVRYMLSRSPKHPASGFDSGGGGGGGGASGASGISDRGTVVERGVFSSVSGAGSASMKSSIDAHLTATGGRFRSNTEPASGSAVGGIPSSRSWGNSDWNSLEGEDELGVIGEGAVFGDGYPPHASAELSSNGSTCSAKTTPSVTAAAVAVAVAAAAAAAAAAEDAEPTSPRPTTRAPVLAPGAPTIDGHARRFAGNQQLKGSSSSFASTSFESGTTGGKRALRNEQARVLASWRRSTGTTGNAVRASRTISKVSSSGSAPFGPPRTTSRSSSGAASGVSGGRTRGRMFRRNSSEASGSFLSQGSSSVSSWRSPAHQSPAALREAYSRSGSSGPVEFEMLTPAAAAAAAAAEESEDGQNPIVVGGDSRNLGSDWVPTQTARSGWPLDLPSSSAMPRWWVKYASRSGGGDSSQSDLAAGAPPDLVLAAAERAKAAEREAAEARVEAVFGDDKNDPERRFSNADGGSNIVDFQAFVRAGGSGTSSFDSRATTASSETSRRRDSGRPADDKGGDGTDRSDFGGSSGGGDFGSGGGGGGGKRSAAVGVDARAGVKENRKRPTVRSRSSMSSGAAATPLTSAELKQHLDPDFEDEGEGATGERPASFVRVSERVDKINAKVVGSKRGGSIQQASPVPWPASRGPV